ncbi:hypothetical protein [uncultured Draconibacterium sp.]|uniref:hypothetical protein n=1 Tax=uncultured Draconibacterium sp. TaxID=1573823 RepID=UPI0025D1BBA4|nr:hypothetical protein [uncultured Draconibacterium sp.]
MPINFINTDCSPLVIDNDYEIINKDLLANYVGELLLGHHHHVYRIINSLSTNFPVHPNDSIEQIIQKITSASIPKRDGWLFQMISWIVLAENNKGEKYYSNYPHFAPAQHGIDGLAIVLDNEDNLSRIIITEDKCTTSPRGKITQQVFPEFLDFEDGKKNNALVSIISSLIGHIDAGNILEGIQNDIFDNDYRNYRISITREESHNDIAGRKRLFKNYENYVSGDNSSRRTGATVYLEDMRVWMEDFSTKVIAFLESKKSTDV